MRDEALIQSHTYSSEDLPQDFVGVVTLSWVWRSRAAIPAHHMLFRCLESPEQAHAVLVRIAYLRHHRTSFRVPLADGLTFDVLFYRTRGEIYYCDRLSRVETFTWKGAPAALPEAMCWARPILRAKFGHLYWRTRWDSLQDFIFDERRWRPRTGLFVLYQNTEIDCIAPAYRRYRYAQISA